MAYTNSSLVTYTKLSPNCTKPRKQKIDTITIHCFVGQVTAQSGANAKGFTTYDPNHGSSCNYVVGYDGSIGLVVEEANRSWCSGGKDKKGNAIRVNGISGGDNDHRAITIEVASESKHPYAVTNKALKALIELVADICKRNDIKELKWKADKSLIGQTDKQNMTVHRWFANKSCPGDYLYKKHSYIAEQVNKKLGVVTTTTTIPTTTPTTNTKSPTTTSAISLKFKKEDIVNFTGNKHYASANAVNGKAVKASKAKIIGIYKFGKHPYQLRAVDNEGKFISGVYGWVDTSDVSEIKKETTVVIPTATDKIDTIKEVQKWANTNYHAALVVDGSYGSKTKKALIKILQTELNQTYNTKLAIDGSFGSKTRAACPNLRKGTKNDVVGVLQALLICNGYSEAYLDKSYGSATVTAVKSYQKKNGLTVDGVAGKNTFAKLCD